MKYKPTIWGITREVAKLKNPNLTLLSGILETAFSIGTAHYMGFITCSCGNPECNEAFTLKRGGERPLVCARCGEEMDWEDITTRKIKVCPQCKREYSLDDNYCSYHIPKIALIEKEIPF